MQDEINLLKNNNMTDAKEKFETDLKSFAGENPDIVRYVKDIDNIAIEHPTLMADIPKLYTLAKRMAEGRKTKRKETETPGTSTDKVIPIQQSVTIAGAFDLAQKTMGGK